MNWIYNLTKEELKYKKVFKKVLCIDEVNVFSYWDGIIVCGVIIPEICKVKVKDSKQLSNNQISKIANILKTYLEFYIDEVSVLECNRNYLYYEYKAMIRIIKKAKPNAVIIDYYTIPNLQKNVHFNVWQLGYYRADERLWTCASASILAKYEINNRWDDFIKKYPGYINTGRGTLTRKCIEPIFEYGALKKYHRVNWIKSALNTMKVNYTTINNKDKVLFILK